CRVASSLPRLFILRPSGPRAVAPEVADDSLTEDLVVGAAAARVADLTGLGGSAEREGRAQALELVDETVRDAGRSERVAEVRQALARSLFVFRLEAASGSLDDSLHQGGVRMFAESLEDHFAHGGEQREVVAHVLLGDVGDEGSSERRPHDQGLAFEDDERFSDWNEIGR